MSEAMGTAQADQLVLPDVLSIKDELAIVDPSTIEVKDDENAALTAQAKEVAERLFALEQDDHKLLQSNRAAIETMGLKAEQASASKSEMLQRPIHTISKRAEDGGEVGKALVDLKVQVESLDPARFDFDAGFISRILGYLPFIGTPMKRYFTRFETSQTVLGAIKNSLIEGQKQLERDNITLADDQVHMKELADHLEIAVKLGQLVDTHLSAKLDRETDEARKTFIMEEILFPLRQRIQDLQQSIVVNQQGVVAIELIMRTNKELIRGVDRAVTTTLSALNIAVLVATAVADQKIVLDKIIGVKQVTENMIANTAKALKQNVAATNKMASSTALDMDILRQSFADISAALEDISSFRQNALPKMAETIIELDKMTAEQGDVIKKLEEGNEVAGNLAIQIG